MTDIDSKSENKKKCLWTRQTDTETETETDRNWGIDHDDNIESKSDFNNDSYIESGIENNIESEGHMKSDINSDSNKHWWWQ